MQRGEYWRILLAGSRNWPSKTEVAWSEFVGVCLRAFERDEDKMTSNDMSRIEKDNGEASEINWSNVLTWERESKREFAT